MTKLEKFLVITLSIIFLIFSISLLYKISSTETDCDKLKLDCDVLKWEISHLKIEIEALGLKNCCNATITAYSARVGETDDSPEITASLNTVREGDIAVSRDLFLDGWCFGKRVYIYQYGVFTIADLMNKRYQKSIDIFMWNTNKAKSFGKKENIFVCLMD